MYLYSALLYKQAMSISIKAPKLGGRYQSSYSLVKFLSEALIRSVLTLQSWKSCLMLIFQSVSG